MTLASEYLATFSTLSGQLTSSLTVPFKKEIALLPNFYVFGPI